MSVPRETKPVEPAGPFDPWDSPYWDLWHWEISDPDERAALEAAEVERLTDLHDAPPLSQVSPEEWAMMSGGLAVG
jgi:hypothetical protein